MTKKKCKIVDFDEHGFTVKIPNETPINSRLFIATDTPLWSWLKSYGIAPYLEEDNMNTFVYRIKIGGAWFKSFIGDGLELTFRQSKAWTSNDQSIATDVVRTLIGRGFDPRLDATQEFIPCIIKLADSTLYISSYNTTLERLYFCTEKNKARQIATKHEYDNIMLLASKHKLMIVASHD